MNRSNLSGSAANAVSRSRAPEVDRSLMTQSLATSLKIALPQRSSGLRAPRAGPTVPRFFPHPANGEHCRQAVKLPLTVESPRRLPEPSFRMLRSDAGDERADA